MPIITLSRQYGSLGSIIANQLAQQLHYRLVWRELINQAAIQAGAPEAALAFLDELNLLGLSLTTETLQAYTRAVRTVMLEFAAQGDTIIVGRAGQIVLADYPQTLHVRTVAPLNLRASRISERHHISLKAALKQVEASDLNRRRFYKRAYSANWEDPLLYDLVINTSQIDADQACELIRLALPIDPGRVSASIPQPGV